MVEKNQDHIKRVKSNCGQLEIVKLLHIILLVPLLISKKAYLPAYYSA